MALVTMVAVLGLLPHDAHAQEDPAPIVFHACYIPRTGVVYRVMGPDLPDECRSPRHVPFSWTEGVPGHDHGTLNGLEDDDHPEYVRQGEAGGGDLGGTYPDPSVVGLRGNALSDAEPADGQLLGWDGTAAEWAPMTADMVIEDHGNLAGLGDDDHTQYLLADGVRNTSDGFAVTGSERTGAIPATGAGTRLMWYPGKAALRAGRVDGSEWDDANIGPRSVAMGWNTTASGLNSTAFGFGATASGGNATAMGLRATASGDNSTALGTSTASGERSVAMGFSTDASGDNSTAMGRNASTLGNEGSFVYGDASTDDQVFVLKPNSFVVRAQRVWFGKSGNQEFSTGRYIETSTGGYLSDGGVWTDASSRAWKKDFRPVEPEVVLRKVARLPVAEWSYKAESDGVRHIGPVAEDFSALFGVGSSDQHLASLDVGGVSLAAIQALAERTTGLRERVSELEAENDSLRTRLIRLEARLDRLEGSAGSGR